MSKFLVIAAEVVGGVALIASGVGALGTIGVLGNSLAAAAATTLATQVATVAGIAAAALGVGAKLLAKKQSAVGSPTEWRANPDQGIDLVLGDAYNSGGIVYRQTYGDNNKYETIVTCWSLGPVDSINQLYVDGVNKSVTGQVVNIDDRGKMYENRQRGLCPEPTNLNVAPIDPYGWTAACKLSGKAAIIDTFVYDSKGGHTFTSIPNCGWRGKGLMAWDPRLDSTYSGGSGAQRSGDQTTWAWSANPFLVALAFLIGWHQNGKLAGGVGAPLSGIIIDQFVEGANIADANGWRVGGVKSTTDDPWDVFKDVLQAGSAEPLKLGAKIGCLVNTPRVRLATIDRNCLAKGNIVVPAMNNRRDRINAISPTYLQESQVITEDSDGNLITTTTWASAPGAAIIVDDYVTADGKERRKPVSYPLVQCYAGGDAKQIATLARYDIENSREVTGISLPLKLRWMGYKPGDCLGLKLPEAGIEDQDILLLNRSLEPSTSTVTITARTETASKHPFALGQTTTPPPSPSVAVYDPSVKAPAPGSWTLDGETLSGSTGSVPALLVTGASDNDQADAVIIEQRLHVDGQGADDGWYNGMLLQPSITRLDITAVAPSASYDVSVRYRIRGVLGGRLILGPATAGVLTAGNALQQAVLNSWIVEVSAGTTVVSAAADGTVTITNNTRRYPDGHADVSVTGASIASGLAAGQTGMLAYDDPSRVGGAVTYHVYTNDNDAHASAANPGRHYMGYFTIPTTGSAGGGGGGVGGGYCVSDDTPILMANGNGPGQEKVAADVVVGDYVWTQHETTMQWGAYRVSAIEFVEDAVYRAEGYPLATADHLFWIVGKGWTRMADLGAEEGSARVAKITVDGAHTYVSAGVLSHNIKAAQV